MQLSIAICDDESVYQFALKTAVEQWAAAKHREADVVTHLYSSGEDLLYDLEKGFHFSIIFLDIEIPGEINGLKIAKTIFERDPYIALVFVTNYSSYACDGYEVNALRYILKPFTYVQIEECLDIVWKKNQLHTGYSVVIKEGTSVISIPLSSIISIEAIGHTLCLSTSEHKQYKTRQKLSELINKMDSRLIVRCHRSYAVNLMYIRKLAHKEITLMDDSIIPLSRKYEVNLYSAFINYHQGR